MSTAVSAEVERLARLLRCEAGDLDFLGRFPVEELRRLRLAVWRRMYDDQLVTYARIGSASRLLPVRAVAALAQRTLPPRVSAGVVVSLPPEHAAALAGRMSVDYIAEVAGFLSPDLAEPFLTRLPVEVVTSVAEVLGERGDYATMAEIVSVLSAEQFVAVVEATADGATLVEVTLRITDPEAVRSLVALIPAECLRDMVAWARPRRALWPELLALLPGAAAEHPFAAG